MEAEDIGIMFLENNNVNYTLAKQLQIAIKESLDGMLISVTKPRKRLRIPYLSVIKTM